MTFVSPGDEALKNEKMEIADKLKSNDKVSVIIKCSSSSKQPVLNVVKEIGKKFTIIGSDGWGS